MSKQMTVTQTSRTTASGGLRPKKSHAYSSAAAAVLISVAQASIKPRRRIGEGAARRSWR
jgi:hypothetical protein